MKYIRNFLYAIVLILLLQVIKTVADKMELPWSYFLGLVMRDMQFLICLAVIFSFIALRFFPKYTGNRKGILLMSGIFLLCIGALECLTVYWLNHPRLIPVSLEQPYKFYYDQYGRKIIQYDDALATYDTALFYKFKPGVNGRFVNAEFNTRIHANSLGLRDEEAALQKPAIVCLGDSYAMGWGVEQEEAFPAQLAAISGMKVLNGAMSSYGTAREMIRLKMLDTTAIKYLIIQYCANDYMENDQFLQHAHKLPVSAAITYDSLVRMNNWNVKYFPGKVFLTVGQLFLKMQINKLHPFFAINGQEEGHLESRLHALKFLEVLNDPAINFQKIKVIVVLVDGYQYRNTTFNKELQTLVQQPPYKQKFAAGLEVVDIYKDLSKQDYYQLDPHIRPSGHKKIAERLWKTIQQ